MSGSRTPIEIVSGSRRLPRGADVVIVPVAPDLQMVAGAARMMRGITAGKAQQEALAHAPLPVGEAILVAGAKYRYDKTALAVVMDDQKQWNEETIAAALTRAIAVSAEAGLHRVTIPDWTPDLMRQPRVQDREIRITEAQIVGRAIACALFGLPDGESRIRLWIPEEAIAAVYRKLVDDVEQSGACGATRR